MISNHYSQDRRYREELIKSIGEGNPVAEFFIDKGHWHGVEKHIITDTGIIIIYALGTGDLVTKLIARPNQIKRYYKNNDYPQYLVDIAYEHMTKGYNN